MVHHMARRASAAPAQNWCDECGSDKPVWFRGTRSDVVSLCAECAPNHGKGLRDRLAGVGSSSALRERMLVGSVA